MLFQWYIANRGEAVRTRTELDGPSGPTAQQCHLNTKTALQLEAVEPHTIAIITICSGGEIYRSYITYYAINIALEC